MPSLPGKTAHWDARRTRNVPREEDTCGATAYRPQRISWRPAALGPCSRATASLLVSGVATAALWCAGSPRSRNSVCRYPGDSSPPVCPSATWLQAFAARRRRAVGSCSSGRPITGTGRGPLPRPTGKWGGTWADYGSFAWKGREGRWWRHEGRGDDVMTLRWEGLVYPLCFVIAHKNVSDGKQQKRLHPESSLSGIPCLLVLNLPRSGATSSKQRCSRGQQQQHYGSLTSPAAPRIPSEPLGPGQSHPGMSADPRGRRAVRPGTSSRTCEPSATPKLARLAQSRRLGSIRAPSILPGGERDSSRGEDRDEGQTDGQVDKRGREVLWDGQFPVGEVDRGGTPVAGCVQVCVYSLDKCINAILKSVF